LLLLLPLFCCCRCLRCLLLPASLRRLLLPLLLLHPIKGITRGRSFGMNSSFRPRSMQV
jgi:hypothetical protein